MFFFVSKMLAFLTHPFSWISIALLISWITKRPKLARYSFRGAIIALLVFSNTAIFFEFARLWETDGTKIEEVGHYDCAIVLGGLAEYDNTNKRLSIRRGADRIWQTINLYHLGKVDKIMISGDNGFLMNNPLQEAIQFKEVLIENGIPEQHILVETRSKNTYENAVESKKIIDSRDDIESILLVTSALHMRRAKGCFRMVRFEDFDTFTTDHYTGDKRGFTIDQFIIPNASTLASWERLIHEWIGYVAYKFMGYL